MVQYFVLWVSRTKRCSRSTPELGMVFPSPRAFDPKVVLHSMHCYIELCVFNDLRLIPDTASYRHKLKIQKWT